MLVTLTAKKDRKEKTFLFYFFRGLNIVGLLFLVTSSIEYQRGFRLLPKFDSKILITCCSENVRPGSDRCVKLVMGLSCLKKENNSTIGFFFFFFLQNFFFQFWFFILFLNESARRHPQHLGVLQYQGHVQPRSGASTAGPQPRLKQITWISCSAMRYVPEIKLIRTDTTLDLSQKAEKVWLLGAPVRAKRIRNA